MAMSARSGTQSHVASEPAFGTSNLIQPPF